MCVLLKFLKNRQKYLDQYEFLYIFQAELQQARTTSGIEQKELNPLTSNGHLSRLKSTNLNNNIINTSGYKQVHTLNGQQRVS